MSMSAMSLGAAGMQRASDRFEASASRVARFGTGLGEVDLATEMVEVLEAKLAFKANATMVRKADEMAKSLIDILA
ncbi:MAG TPA: flagellar basal body rod C-terminal domain-containing protein [Devosia sp.]